MTETSDSASLKTRDLPLRNLQQWMQAVLIDPLGAAEQAPSSHLPPDFREGRLEDIIQPSSRLTAKQRLAIYQRSYLARLRDCMSNQFPALEYALGKELFQHFADQYLQMFPSNSHTLMDLGERFALYMQKTRPDAQEEIKEDWPDFMIELAQFEYAILSLFDAQLNEAHSPVYEVSHDHALTLNPGLMLFKHRFPVGRYYLMYLNNTSPDLPFPLESFTVLLRKEYKVSLFELNADQYVFLEYWQKSGEFEQARQWMINAREVDAQQFDEMWTLWRSKWKDAGFFLRMDITRDRPSD